MKLGETVPSVIKPRGQPGIKSRGDLPIDVFQGVSRPGRTPVQPAPGSNLPGFFGLASIQSTALVFSGKSIYHGRVIFISQDYVPATGVLFLSPWLFPFSLHVQSPDKVNPPVFTIESPRLPTVRKKHVFILAAERS
jgi:hypothetical protein